MSREMTIALEQPWRASDRTFLDTLTAILAWNFLGAVMAILFVATFNADVPPARIFSRFTDSLVYANCIGTLVTFAVLRATPLLRQLQAPLAWVLLTLLTLALAFIGTIAAGITLMALGSFPRGDYSWLALHRMGLGLLLALITGFGTYLYEGVRLRLQATTQALRTQELERERSQKLAAQASLASLESRIHPHFLFNTLNSISSLIQEDPSLADRMIGRLAALLRFSLDSNHRSSIPLEQELKIAVDYLEIEKVRFGERLRYSVDVPASLHDVRVPPFVIQTLVENSVKHAVASQRKGGTIRVAACANGSQMTIEVSDEGPGFTADSIPPGHGLDNLRARLDALFGNEAHLDVLNTIVRVTVPS